jgi:hypothetical protein
MMGFVAPVAEEPHVAESYQHRHFGTVIVFALAPSIVLVMALGLLADLPVEGQVITWSVALVLLLALYLFWSLSVRVDGEAVTVWFGPGWPRTRVPLADIEAAESVTKSWLWGFGLRWTPRGWLWRVSGLHAVELRRGDRKSLFVGTDDPEGLVHAIRAAKA